GMKSIFMTTEKMSALLKKWGECFDVIVDNLGEIDNNLILKAKCQEHGYSPQLMRVHELINGCLQIGREFKELREYFQENLAIHVYMMDVPVNGRSEERRG